MILAALQIGTQLIVIVPCSGCFLCNGVRLLPAEPANEVISRLNNSPSPSFLVCKRNAEMILTYRDLLGLSWCSGDDLLVLGGDYRSCYYFLDVWKEKSVATCL